MNLRIPRTPIPGAIECVLAALEKPLPPPDPLSERRVQILAEELKRKRRRPWRDDWGKPDV